MPTEITLIEASKQEHWNKNQNFSIISYDTNKDSLAGPTINLLVSHQKWMQRKNEAPLNTKNILNYIEENGKNFIQEKINIDEITFSDKQCPALEPQDHEIF